MHGRLRRCCRAVGIEPRGFCGRPWHPLHIQAICGSGDRSRLRTLGTTEPFACRCPNVNKMLQMCDKKITKCDSSRSHFWRSDQFTLFKKTTTNASLRLYQIVICRKKRQKKSMFTTPLRGEEISKRLGVVSHIQRIGCQPEKLLYTMANPARGLLNRENKGKRKEKVWRRPPPTGVASQNSTLFPCAITTFPVSLPLSSPGDVWPRLPLLPSTRP